MGRSIEAATSGRIRTIRFRRYGLRLRVSGAPVIVIELEYDERAVVVAYGNAYFVTRG